MRKTAIVNMGKRETVLVVSTQCVVIRKFKFDNINYQPLLDSINNAVQVDRTYHGLVRGKRIKLIPITGKNCIILYFDNNMEVTDYFYKNKVYFVKE